MLCRSYWVMLLTSFYMSSVMQAQVQASSDSLLQLLQSTTEQFKQVDLYNELAQLQVRDNPTYALELIETALEICEEIDYPKGKSKALATFAASALFMHPKELVIQYADSSILIAEQYNYPLIVAEAKHQKGLAYQLNGEYDEALVNYHEALTFNESIRDSAAMLKQLNNIAIVRRDLKDYESALQYLEKGMTISEVTGMDRLNTFMLGNKGFIYLDQKKYNEALPIVLQAYQQSQGINDGIAETISANILAQVKLGLGEKEEAIQYATEALEIAQRIGYNDGMFNARVTTADYYYQNQQYNKSIAIGKEALSSIDSSLTTRYLDKALQIIAKSYEKKGDYKQALEYQGRYLEVRDDIFHSDQQNLSMRLDADFQTKAKERENESLKRKALLNEELITKQRYIYIGASLMALLGLLLSFNLFNSLKFRRNYSQTLERAINERTNELETQNKKLEQSNTELERFAYIASHDLKEPLLNLMSFSKLLDKEVANSSLPKLKEYSNIINTSSKRMYHLVESILEFSKLNDGKLLQFKNTDLNDLILEVEESLKSTLNEGNVQIISKELPMVHGNSALLFLVFKNIIENAIKFNKREQVIIIISASQKEHKGRRTISIKDNGIGIPKEFEERIFEMFNRLNNRNDFVGTGMGLAICKKIIELHKGKIWVESVVEKGSEFKFTLPIKETV